MPTNDALAIAQTQNPSTSEFSGLTRAELEAELEKLRRRETLLYATERAARIGHYEWNYELDRLESCSKEYANLYNMTVEEVMAAQDSWEKTVQQIHPDDQERPNAAAFAGGLLGGQLDQRRLFDDEEAQPDALRFQRVQTLEHRADLRAVGTVLLDLCFEAADLGVELTHSGP